jgi:hypothetical protein
MSDEIYLFSSASFDEVRRSRRPDGSRMRLPG